VIIEGSALSYESNTTLKAIAGRLLEADRIIITTHTKPDGDALGSVAALARALELRDKQPQAWLMPPVPDNLSVLSERMHIRRVRGDGYEKNDGEGMPVTEPDAIIVLDTGAWSQLDPMRAYLSLRRERVTVIDHHVHGDDVGAMLYVDSEAAAACEIVAELIDLLKVKHDQLIRDALFIGIASDTGWFRFSNTRPRTHRLAGRLLEEGADHAELYRRIEQAERPEKLALMIRALDSLQLVGTSAAVMTLRATDFAETGAKQEETERFVDVPQLVDRVEVVALITEQADGPTRLSFRSKPGANAVNVSDLARQFGGGGHARAAGARLFKSVDEVRRAVVAALEQLDVARHV
jgi:phosphoesterase RecJ-like protein